MENEFFLNAGISMPTWHSLSSAIELQTTSPDQSSDCFYNPNWEKSTDHNLNFDSALSSMVSSPVASNSNISNDNNSFVIRELIGKLGNIGNSGEISPHHHHSLAPPHLYSTNTSCYTTPLNSPPPKLNLPIMDHHNHLIQEKLPNLGNNTMALNSSSVAEFSTDPGFAERAAKFSRFGSRSFNGRTTTTSQLRPQQQSPKNISDFNVRSSNNPLMGANEKHALPRVSSSPSLKLLGSQANNKNSNSNSPLDRSELANSQEESSVSEQVITNGNVVGSLKGSNDFNSRKRKAVSKGKTTVAEANDHSKRCKPNQNEKTNLKSAATEEEPKAEEEAINAGDEKQTTKTNNTKPPEPPKLDYIHVRARRGQATDSHSLAERVRREKISERMKLLQDIVPGCNKVTGKALMLDEIINYVQSLQRQVEFLSMKLSSVNTTRMDFNMDSLISNKALPQQQQIFSIDSSASAFLGHQAQQNPAMHSNNICNGTTIVDPLCRNLNLQLPHLDQFIETVPQYATFSEDDLQSIVQMGCFGQNSNQDSHMKIEL